MATSNGVARNAVLAARAAGVTDPQHTAVYQPWEALDNQAAARLKVEMSEALAEYETACATAGRMLDLAYAAAAGPAAALRQAAWTAFDKYMSMADDYASAVIDPAVTEYNTRVTNATTAYNDALATASKVFKAQITAANAAKTEAASIPKAS